MSIDLSPEHRRIVDQILDARVPCAIWVFGSRGSGCAKPYSDLDLVLVSEQTIPPTDLAELEEDFSESDLPFKVDVLEWSALDEGCRRIVESRWQVLRPPLSRADRGEVAPPVSRPCSGP